MCEISLTSSSVSCETIYTIHISHASYAENFHLSTAKHGSIQLPQDHNYILQQ